MTCSVAATLAGSNRLAKNIHTIIAAPYVLPLRRLCPEAGARCQSAFASPSGREPPKLRPAAYLSAGTSETPAFAAARATAT